MLGDFLIQGNHDTATLRRLVSMYFQVDLLNIGSIYDKEHHDVNIEVYTVRGNFHRQLSVFASEHVLSGAKGADFALFLSHELNQDVLISYWDNNPYLWILVQPNGHLYKVFDIPNEEESERSESFFLKLDQTFKEELNLSDVRLNTT